MNLRRLSRPTPVGLGGHPPCVASMKHVYVTQGDDLQAKCYIPAAPGPHAPAVYWEARLLPLRQSQHQGKQAERWALKIGMSADAFELHVLRSAQALVKRRRITGLVAAAGPTLPATELAESSDGAVLVAAPHKEKHEIAKQSRESVVAAPPRDHAVAWKAAGGPPEGAPELAISTQVTLALLAHSAVCGLDVAPSGFVGRRRHADRSLGCCTCAWFSKLQGLTGYVLVADSHRLVAVSSRLAMRCVMQGRRLAMENLQAAACAQRAAGHRP